jgi:hypothetical protein
MKKMKKLLLAVAMLAIIVSVSVADDLNPPPWRGLPGTTTTEWLFNTQNPQPPPDFERNPYNREGHGAMMTTEPNTFWEPFWANRTGVWHLSGGLNAWLWNRPEPNPLKEIWVQITWWSDLPGMMPIVTERAPGTPDGRLVGDILQLDGWRTSTFLITLPYNPPWEEVIIRGDIWVDQLVIDTYCVPEPSTIIALVGGLGSLLAFRRRRA